MRQKSFRVLAPGRICLFGEHSDYLGLAVIPVSIDLAITIEAHPIEEPFMQINFKDLGEIDRFAIGQRAKYRRKRDYVRSAFNVVRDEHARISGWELSVTGNIPLAAGLSSSSALAVAAVVSFAEVFGKTMNKQEFADAAFQAEVTEFGESGGRMDHYASVFGGPLYLDSSGHSPLPAELNGFLIGDSLEPKTDTVGDLARIRIQVEEGYDILKSHIKNFDHRTTPLDEVEKYIEHLPDSCRRTTITTLRNRDLTYRARLALMKQKPDPHALGEMIDQHHALLRDGLDRSTKKIENMITAAKEAGALGCKINGSGGGGTMVAYAPGKETAVAQAIESSGGIAYKVSIGQGATLTLL